MARTDTLGHFLTDVADAIREKTGSSEEIQASDFDTEIESIPSGGGTTPTSYSELNSQILNSVQSFSEYLLSLNKINAPTTPVTLYTPDANNQQYAIRYRQSGYQIIWLPDNVLAILVSNDTSFATRRFQQENYVLNSPIDTIQYNAPAYASTMSNSSTYYSSPYYSTLEECLEAIKSSVTQYTSGRSSTFATDGNNDEIKSNMPFFNNDGTPYSVTAISQNETINVIS